jgi:hypothetical protein
VQSAAEWVFPARVHMDAGPCSQSSKQSLNLRTEGSPPSARNDACRLREQQRISDMYE